MGEGISPIIVFLQQPFLLGLLIILLLGYSFIARRPTSRLPKIPLGFFILFLAILAASPLIYRLRWPAAHQVIDVVAVIAVCFGIIRLLAFVVLDYLIGSKKSIQIPAITRDVILVVLYVIAVMIILRQKLNIDVTSVVATSAILTAIIGLALQDTLGNLFSGLALNIEKPYQIGDWVTFDKYRGQVRGMSWRSTVIITPENESIAVPNNVISRSHIVNYSNPSTLIVSGFTIGIDYGTPPNYFRDVVIQTLRSHSYVLSDREMEVRLIDFGDHSIKYEIRYWIDIKNNYEEADRIKSDLMTQLWYRLRRTGIKIPYPIRVQYQAKAPPPDEILLGISTAIRNIDLFASLSDEHCELLARSVSVLEFAEGEVIVRQDEPGECMYVIASGFCEVAVAGKLGRMIKVAELRKGDFFGEMSLMTGEARSATVSATRDTVLYEIAKDDIMKLLEVSPAISTTISELLAKRIEERSTKIAEDHARTATTKPPSASQILNRIKNFFHIT